MEKMRVILITLFLFIAAAVAEDADIGDAINHMLKFNQAQAYESGRLKRFVTHCSSHVAETCSEPLQHENGSHWLAPCLFNSMERCLVDHGAPLYETTPAASNDKTIQYRPVLLIETLKFQTVLRTCAHVSARTCLITPNVVASDLAACLIPSLNQCVYPGTAESGSPPIKA